ncbi:hypothetical protein CCHL11_08357 [Colletotrichum chlorophyti]|uniref:Extracellular membrane protein CFEM domain-containing protein n=1 Tax=Colletotrichum chlorophyti TaxID=708187 RepID=A0A1Q8RZV3_9PEZI|nr:hypothetical protein CCHL11_08357 [Colletotrichum chlorophyti]
MSSIGLGTLSPRSVITIGALLAYPLASTAKTTAGALAPVSVWSELAYSTARACAAGCLVYNGVYPCGVAGYQDLGVALQCGCQSINGCFCNTALGSSATSYLSSCISRGCSKVENWSVDLTSMLNLYDSYCATANIPVANTAVATTAGGQGATTTGATAPKTLNNAQPSQTSGPKSGSGSGSESSGTSSADAQNTSAAAEDAGGLSRSDIVALAASLGVGIPSLLIAGLTLYFQIKKKKKKEAVATQSPVQEVPQETTYTGYTAAGTPPYDPYTAGAKGWQYP